VRWPVENICNDVRFHFESARTSHPPRRIRGAAAAEDRPVEPDLGAETQWARVWRQAPASAMVGRRAAVGSFKNSTPGTCHRCQKPLMLTGTEIASRADRA